MGIPLDSVGPRYAPDLSGRSTRKYRIDSSGALVSAQDYDRQLATLGPNTISEEERNRRLAVFGAVVALMVRSQSLHFYYEKGHLVASHLPRRVHAGTPIDSYFRDIHELAGTDYPGLQAIDKVIVSRLVFSDSSVEPLNSSLRSAAQAVEENVANG